MGGFGQANHLHTRMNVSAALEGPGEGSRPRCSTRRLWVYEIVQWANRGNLQK